MLFRSAFAHGADDVGRDDVAAGGDVNGQVVRAAGNVAADGADMQSGRRAAFIPLGRRDARNTWNTRRVFKVRAGRRRAGIQRLDLNLELQRHNPCLDPYQDLE